MHRPIHKSGINLEIQIVSLAPIETLIFCILSRQRETFGPGNVRDRTLRL